jgi:cystathionine beta-lyase
MARLDTSLSRHGDAGAHPGNADGHFYYGRRGAPTQWALAEALTELEPGAQGGGTVLYPSGVSAICGALLTVLRPGDTLLLTDNAYEPSRAMARGLLADLGVKTVWFDPMDSAAFAALCPGAAAVLLEAPGSLTMEVPDMPALIGAAKAQGLAVLVDNTWASPLGFAPLAHGADISIMSLTKHVSGHSDVVMGSTTAAANGMASCACAARPGPGGLARRCRDHAARPAHHGPAAGSLHRRRPRRGAVARPPEVARVLCPMLPGSPGHALAARFHRRLRAVQLRAERRHGQGARRPDRCPRPVRHRLQLWRV